MKAFIEVALMWGIALAVVFAVFLLNFWINERRQDESIY
nr:MAG TPA: chitin synthase regulator [Caudoviricetes sp.]